MPAALLPGRSTLDGVEKPVFRAKTPSAPRKNLFIFIGYLCVFCGFAREFDSLQGHHSSERETRAHQGRMNPGAPARRHAWLTT